VGAVQDTARQFVMSHGLAVRAVGLLVDDAAAAYSAATEAGGEGVTPPHTLDSADGAGRSVCPLRDNSLPVCLSAPVAAASSPHLLGSWCWWVFAMLEEVQRNPTTRRMAM